MKKANSNSKIIIQAYNEAFPVEKIKEDLLSYLNDNLNNWFKTVGEKFLVNIFNKDNCKIESVSICSDDDITLINFSSFFENCFDFNYNIIIGIGNFRNDKEDPSFYTISKCLAKLRYNEDLTLYDIDFFIYEVNKEQ